LALFHAFWWEPFPDDSPELDEFAFRDFKRDIVKAFGGKNERYDKIPSRDAYYFGETDKLRIGIDSGGGSPCIFVTPKENEETEEEFEIQDEVTKAFNSLISDYGGGFFSAATSAWTSSPLYQY
jgi:hypothetical protein